MSLSSSPPPPPLPPNHSFCTFLGGPCGSCHDQSNPMAAEVVVVDRNEKEEYIQYSFIKIRIQFMFMMCVVSSAYAYCVNVY
jgi:hypothetical protein